MSTGLRERKKLHVREQLVEAATRLFDAHGYDAVTVEQIAEEALVSSRTFFRYFGSKEAVLFADQDEMLDMLRETIAAQPRDATPIEVLHGSVITLSRHYAEHREKHLRRARLARSGVEVGTYQKTVLEPLWEQTIASALAVRLGVAVDVDVRPRLFAGVGMAVMHAIGPLVLAPNGDADLDSLIDEAFDVLGSVTRPHGEAG